MNTRTVLLSYPLNAETPMYGDTRAPEIAHINSIAKGDSSNTFSITLCNHSGTHVDAPAHFIDDGRRISDYQLADLEFNRPFFVEIRKQAGEWVEKKDLEQVGIPKDADCLLIKTGFCMLRSQSVYKTNNPGITPDAIRWLRGHASSLRCIGIDALSISGFQNRQLGREAHKAAFEKIYGGSGPLLVLEDVDLNNVTKKTTLKKLTLVPWLIDRIDSAPCTILAEITEAIAHD